MAASSTPRVPDRTASTALSVSIWRTRRTVLAPESGAHGNFALAGGSTREHQIGHVGAGNQEHKSHGAGEQKQARTHISHDGVEQRGYAKIPGPIIGHDPGKHGQHLAVERPKFRLSLAGRDAIAQTANCLVVEYRSRGRTNRQL